MGFSPCVAEFNAMKEETAKPVGEETTDKVSMTTIIKVIILVFISRALGRRQARGSKQSPPGVLKQPFSCPLQRVPWQQQLHLHWLLLL